MIQYKYQEDTEIINMQRRLRGVIRQGDPFSELCLLMKITNTDDQEALIRLEIHSIHLNIFFPHLLVVSIFMAPYNGSKLD